METAAASNGVKLTADLLEPAGETEKAGEEKFPVYGLSDMFRLAMHCNAQLASGLYL